MLIKMIIEYYLKLEIIAEIIVMMNISIIEEEMKIVKI